MTKTQLDEFEALLEETLSKTYTVADIVFEFPALSYTVNFAYLAPSVSNE